MKYYFMKTVTEKSRIRLRPIAGQTLDGLPINENLNVQADKPIRAMYPVGTVFGTESLEAGSGFYVAGKIYPCLPDTTAYREPSHVPPMEMLEAYAKFIGATVSAPEPAHTSDTPPARRGSYLEKLIGNEALSPPDIKEGFYVDRDIWYLLIRNIVNGINTMIIGPTGSGKTSLVRIAAAKIGKAFRVYDMGSMYDPVAGLLGVHRLAEGGVSVFDYAKFTQDVQEEGVLLLDELSRAPVTTNNILFPCLDDRRSLPVEIAGASDKRQIPVHEDCCFVATANIGAEYTGTMSMDKALVNRFFPIELDYLKPDQEQQILQIRTGIGKGDALNVVRIAENIRNMYAKQEVSSSISTRETLMVAELLSDGWPLIKSLELVILPLFEGTKLEGERSTVYKALTAR
jgi:MoxR-like ATPase